MSQIDLSTGPETGAETCDVGFSVSSVAASNPGAPAHSRTIRDTHPQLAGKRGDRQAKPDLTGLARGTAAKIEMLASNAAIHLGGKIDMVQALLQRADSGSRYEINLSAEVRMWREHLADARAFEAAARRIRTARISDSEYAELDHARAADPNISGSVITTLLLAVPVDPLDLAGMKLDAAEAEFRRLCQSSVGPENEDEFGRADDARDQARAEYRRILAERVGQDADVVARRLEI